MSTRRMATPSRSRKSGSTSAGGSGPMAKRTRSRQSKGPFDFKHALFTTALWALGVMNVILIISFVGKHFLSDRDHNISSEAEVPAIPSQSVKIEILNGCGVDGLARKYADMLRERGYDPVNVATYERLDVSRTYIIDRQSNAMTNGLKLAKALGLPELYVSYQASPDRMVAVTLILGLDYKSIPANPK